MVDWFICYIKQDKSTRELVNWWSSISLIGRPIDNDKARPVYFLIVKKFD